MTVRSVVVAGVLAIGGVSVAVRRAELVRRAPVPNVVVATRDIRRGALIEPTWIARAHWPAERVPPDAFSHVDNVIGRVASVDVFEGEAITNARLTGPNIPRLVDPSGLTRTISLRIENAAELGDALRPDSRVDVFVVVDRGDRRTTKLALEDVPLVGVERVPPAIPGTPMTTMATLEITDVQVERLAAVVSAGPVRLALHHPR